MPIFWWERKVLLSLSEWTKNFLVWASEWTEKFPFKSSKVRLREMLRDFSTKLFEKLKLLAIP